MLDVVLLLLLAAWPAAVFKHTVHPYCNTTSLKPCSGQIWPLSTFDSSTNTLNIILLAWKWPKIHKNENIQKCHTFVQVLQMFVHWGCFGSNLTRICLDGLLIYQCGSNQGNSGFREFWNCKTIQGMFCMHSVWDSGDRGSRGAQHCHENWLCSYQICERHLLVLEGAWGNLETARQ